MTDQPMKDILEKMNCVIQCVDAFISHTVSVHKDLLVTLAFIKRIVSALISSMIVRCDKYYFQIQFSKSFQNMIESPLNVILYRMILTQHTDHVLVLSSHRIICECRTTFW